MTISRPESRRRSAPSPVRPLLPVLAAVLALGGSVASAQQGGQQGPTPLTPSYTPAASPRRDVGVEVAALPAAAADGGGVIDAGQGGFGSALWGASYRPLIERTLTGLPVTSASPAVRDILRRLLLTTAVPPSGGPGIPGGGGGKPRDFAGLRLERVALLGDRDGADQMARLPTALDDAGGAAAWVTLNLLSGDGSACDRVPELGKRFNDPAFQMAAVTCQVRAGSTDGIQLSLDILREQGGKDDAFMRLGESAATGQKAPVKGMTTLSGPAIALARALGHGLPADLPVGAVAGLDGAAAAALADVSDLPAPLRLAAGDRAAAQGQLSASALAELYKVAKVSPGDLKNAATVAAQRRGIDQRTILYQALVGEQTPSLKAKVIARAVDLGDPGLLAGVWGRLLADQLDGIPASADMIDLAPRAVRLLILQGHPERARPWLAVLRALPDDKAAGYRAVLPLAVIGGALAGADADWGHWLTTIKADDDATVRARAGGLLALLVACGERVDPAALARVVDVGTASGLVPGAPSWLQLDQAATGGRQGEAALLALAELPDGGPAAAPALVSTHVVGALATVGLTAEARRMAVEAAAALALPLPAPASAPAPAPAGN